MKIVSPRIIELMSQVFPSESEAINCGGASNIPTVYEKKRLQLQISNLDENRYAWVSRNPEIIASLLEPAAASTEAAEVVKVVKAGGAQVSFADEYVVEMIERTPQPADCRSNWIQHELSFGT